MQPCRLDTSIVPVGGTRAPRRSNMSSSSCMRTRPSTRCSATWDRHGDTASEPFRHLREPDLQQHRQHDAPNGTPFTNNQYTGVSLNTQLLASTSPPPSTTTPTRKRATPAISSRASGTATDYTEKTLLVKAGAACWSTRTSSRKTIPKAATSSTTPPATASPSKTTAR